MVVQEEVHRQTEVEGGNNIRMTLTRFYISLVLVFSIITSKAQNELDALNLSREEVTGSARTVAMGGAFTALGGDFSAIAINPAGIGVLRSNEFSITPAYHSIISNSTYYGTSTIDSKSNFNIGSIGIVGVKDLNKVGKWRSSSVAFGMNRTQSFHKSYTFTGKDVPNSLIDSYQNTLIQNGLGPEDLDVSNAPYGFDIFLAWQNFLLDYPIFDTDSVFYNATGVLPIDQTYRVVKSGSKRQTFLAFGGNYDDKLYVGGSIRFSRINYTNNYIINENINPSDTTTALNEYSFGFNETISGLGAGLDLGVIYRPTNQLRLGASFKTPTVYSLNIEYESENTAIFEGFDPFYTQSPLIGDYDFRLTSPLQASFGLAYVFGKFGLLSADMEYVNYTGIRMQGISDGYSFSPEEDAIQSFLTPTVNLKFGGDYRMSQFVSLRAGYAIFGNPYNSTADNFGGFNLYSLGLGYRNEEYFIDASYQLKTSENKEYLYDPNLVEAGTSDFTDHRISITLGYRF